MYGKILRKILLRIPGVTVEEADLAIDSITHENEINLKEAIKDMATKSDIKNMATKTDLAELKTEMHRINNRTIMWVVGIGLTVIVCNIGAVMALALKLLGV